DRLQLGHQRPQPGGVAGEIEAVVGSELSVGVGYQRGLRRAGLAAQLDQAGITRARGRERVALDVELDSALAGQPGELQHVGGPDVPPVRPGVHGNALGSGIEARRGGTIYVRIVAAARIAEHRDLVDVDAQRSHGGTGSGRPSVTSRTFSWPQSSGDTSRASASGRRARHKGRSRSCRTCSQASQSCRTTSAILATSAGSRISSDSSKFSRKLRWSKLALPSIARSSSQTSTLLCSSRGPYSWIVTPAASSRS